MLVLGCTNHQSVIIDNDIEVTVLNNKQGQVIRFHMTQKSEIFVKV